MFADFHDIVFPTIVNFQASMQDPQNAEFGKDATASFLLLQATGGTFVHTNYQSISS